MERWQAHRAPKLDPAPACGIHGGGPDHRPDTDEAVTHPSVRVRCPPVGGHTKPELLGVGVFFLVLEPPFLEAVGSRVHHGPERNRLAMRYGTGTGFRLSRSGTGREGRQEQRSTVGKDSTHCTIMTRHPAMGNTRTNSLPWRVLRRTQAFPIMGRFRMGIPR